MPIGDATATLLSLPSEVLVLIANCFDLEHRAEIGALACTCRRLYPIMNQYLYRLVLDNLYVGMEYEDRIRLRHIPRWWIQNSWDAPLEQLIIHGLDVDATCQGAPEGDRKSVV